ncbi:DUF2185 domain-containing protein [Pokkaliibacter sp. CJK22405]|uniref:immunity protein Imm33 domain-containing protein n=1 Tax=Pokkaliibacter sp. CJK22405 TaxID=3384615 RepID=UPI00398559BB
MDSTEKGQTKQGFLALVSSLCFGDDACPIRFMYKTVPAHLNDTGWRMYSGYETPEQLEDPEFMTVYPVAALRANDNSLEALLEYNAGTVWERLPGAEWERVHDFKIPSDHVAVWVSNDVDDAQHLNS